jgi:hypothetical protein
MLRYRYADTALPPARATAWRLHLVGAHGGVPGLPASSTSLKRAMRGEAPHLEARNSDPGTFLQQKSIASLSHQSNLQPLA